MLQIKGEREGKRQRSYAVHLLIYFICITGKFFLLSLIIKFIINLYNLILFHMT